MERKHIVAAYDRGLLNSLNSSGVLTDIQPYIGHGLLDDSAPGINIDSETEHQRLRAILDSAYLLTVVVSGTSDDEARAIIAAEEKGLACGIILRCENPFAWEALPKLCSKYSFICCINGKVTPSFARLIPYPCEIVHTYGLIRGATNFATNIRIAALLAKRYGRDVPPAHERELEPTRGAYAGNA